MLTDRLLAANRDGLSVCPANSKTTVALLVRIRFSPATSQYLKWIEAFCGLRMLASFCSQLLPDAAGRGGRCLPAGVEGMASGYIG